MSPNIPRCPRNVPKNSFIPQDVLKLSLNDPKKTKILSKICRKFPSLLKLCYFMKKTYISSLLPGGDEPKVINEQHLFYNLGIGMAYIGDWKSCFEVMQKIINPKLYAKAAITRGKVKFILTNIDSNIFPK